MYSRILVPIDGSPTSDRALAEAGQLARLTGARVRLLHIVDPVAHASGFERPETYRQEVQPLALQNAQALLDKARNQLTDAGVTAETELIENSNASVARLVVEHASQWDASVIVLGTQGRHGIERMLLGSDAEQIARHAPMPVLLVRQPARSAP